jgi:DNA repair protein RadA/Sms
MGKCPSCQGWNTLVEEKVSPSGPRRGRTAKPAEVAWLDGVPDSASGRLPTGIPEFDRVLGGGLVPASFVLIGGDPGIGKSTLLLQAAGHLSASAPPVLYVSAEESPAQVKLRASRISVPGTGLAVLAETHMESVSEAVRRLKPSVVVIDSVQTIWTEGMASAPGSVAQVRECAGQLLRLAKTSGCSLFVVCHVTKDGTLAGPKTLEHLADCVLSFEGDRHHVYRMLRAVKNRFGSTNELGVFEMTGAGLREVPSLGDLFLPTSDRPVPGRAVAACMEGSRPLLLEVQALVASAAYGMPQRRSQGVDNNRLAILVAVLEKRAGLHLANSDVFMNIAGGLLIEEPAVDLACALSVVSAFRDRPLARIAMAGEVGLGGEVRPVLNLERRMEEAARMGFTRQLIPAANRRTLTAVPKGVDVQGVEDLGEAIKCALS